jgi:hypothetical protein
MKFSTRRSAGRNHPYSGVPIPAPSQTQRSIRTGKFDEDAQERHGHGRRHAGFRHFRNRARKIGDLAEPGAEVKHNQRATGERPSPVPFKDSLDKLGCGLAIHGMSPSLDAAGVVAAPERSRASAVLPGSRKTWSARMRPSLKCAMSMPVTAGGPFDGPIFLSSPPTPR